MIGEEIGLVYIDRKHEMRNSKIFVAFTFS